MKTKSEEEMLRLILDFAKADDNIRVVLMNGSRVNTNIKKDPFQDYDIANYVNDVKPFKDENYVIPHFGEMIVVEQSNIGPWPPNDADGSYHNYNMQLLDGNRIDISFYHINTLKDRIQDSLTKVLLDKDKCCPILPLPDESSYFIKAPTKKLFHGCCTGFFFALGSHIPKTIWRKKLPLLKFYIEAWLRESVMMMLSWEIGIKTGYEKSIGPKGKYLQNYLDPDVWDNYKKTYVASNYNNLWDSLFLFYRIFMRSAGFVANKYSFDFPKDRGAKVLAFLKHVQKLPEDAKSIY